MDLLGNGVKFAYRTVNSPLGAWNRINGLLDFPAPPAPVADKIETTVHGAAGYKTYRQGLKDVPDITARILFDPSDTDHIAMITALGAGTEYSWRLEDPADETPSTYLVWEWDGYVAKADVSTPINGVQELALAVQYSGNYEFTSTPAATEIT